MTLGEKKNEKGMGPSLAVTCHAWYDLTLTSLDLGNVIMKMMVIRKKRGNHKYDFFHDTQGQEMSH